MSDGIGPQFIRVAIDAVLSLLTDYTPAILAELNQTPFTRFGRAFRGQLMAAPEVWAEPVNTTLDDEGQSRHQIHQVKVTVGLVGGDPEALTDLALDYVRAVDLAVAQNEKTFAAPVLRIFVREHNYGALRVKGTGFAVFPEVFLLVETEEDANG